MEKRVIDKIGELVKVENGKQCIYMDDLDFFEFNVTDYFDLFEILDRNNINIKGIFTNSRIDKIYDTIFEYQKNKSSILRDRLFDNCKGYVYQIAYEYGKKSNIPAEELFSYAYEGFISSIDRYNDSYGFSFRDFCIKTIREYLLNNIRYINNTGVICSVYYNFMNVKSYIEKDLGVTLEEDISILDDILKDLQIIYDYPDSTIKHIRWEYLLRNAMSLDSIKDRYLCDDMEDKITTKVAVNDSLDYLKEKRRNIIKLRYGFIDGHEYICDEIGEICGLTRSGASFAVNDTINSRRLKCRLKDL